VGGVPEQPKPEPESSAPSPEGEEPRSSFRHLWPHVSRRLGAAIGIAAGIATIATSIYALWPDDEQPDAAAQVRACIAQHGLSQAQDQLARGADTIVYATCIWPAPEFAGDDGYIEIAVHSDVGPGDFEASGETIADRIASRCLELEVAYSFGLQGDFEREPPFLVQRGLIMTLAGTAGPELWKGEQRALPFYPERDETVILHSSRHQLDYVRCINPA
jgi:hypothetical protein